MHFSHLLASWKGGGGGCSLLINKLCFEEEIGSLAAAHMDCSRKINETPLSLKGALILKQITFW